MIIQNAFKSIVRSKGRNILIAIIIVAIALSSSVALAIRGAAKTAVQAGFDDTNITGTISYNMRNQFGGRGQGGTMSREDMQNMFTGGGNRPAALTLEEQLKYSSDKNVKDYYYSVNLSMAKTDGGIEAVPNENDGTSGGGQWTVGGGGRGGMTIGASGDFTVVGYSDANGILSNAAVGFTENIEFNFNSDEYYCIISDYLADYNGLTVGDTITLANPNSEGETYTFTVSGVYTLEVSADQSRFYMSTAQDPINQIYISYPAAEKIVANSVANNQTVTNTQTNPMSGQDIEFETETKFTLSAAVTFVFDDKEAYDAFAAAVDPDLPEGYAVSSPDIDNYDESLAPLKNLSKYAMIFLAIILAIGAVVLIILNVFNIRERKYEVGVLCAIGIKKSKVAMQFVSELLMVTLVAILIGTAVGAVASPFVADKLLEGQISSAQTAATDNGPTLLGPNGSAMQFPSGGGRQTSTGGRWNMNATGGNSVVNYFSDINASVGGAVLGQLIAIGILLTVVSSLVGVVFVLRYDPLKILSERA